MMRQKDDWRSEAPEPFAAHSAASDIMANLAQKYLAAGFHDEAEAQLKRGRLTDNPHQNIGAAMVTLAGARETEAEQWAQTRRTALGHKAFLNELADALAAEPAPDALAGPWAVGASATAALAVAGSVVEAAWEDSSDKRRLRAKTFGKALIGSLEEWRELWKSYESKGTIALVPRHDGTLSGFVLSADGVLVPITWKRPS
jgi:hypothetical protein